MSSKYMVTHEMLEGMVRDVSYTVIGETLTICNIICKNGFSVTGESACVDPANFDKKKGEMYAYESAFNKLWPLAERLFDEWKRLCNHPRSDFDWQRFESVKPYLKKHGFDKCLLAVQGAAHDPYKKPRANGTVKRFDGFQQSIFKSAESFEEFCCRAPAAALKEYAEKQRKQRELEEAGTQ